MRTVQPSGAPGFGAATAGELRARALAGGVLATGLVVAGFCLAGFPWSLLLLIAGCGTVASLVSWSLERRRPARRPEARYALVGAAAALGALLLATSESAFLVAGALIALPAGAAGGAAAGLAAARLPTRLLVPAVCLGLAMLAGAAGVAVSRTLPWLSGSYLVAEGPTTAGSAEQLADRIASALRVAPDPLSDAAWEAVASSVVAPREGGRVRIGYDRDAATRKITVLVDGERACVDVRAEGVTAYQGRCRDH